jgi:glycolate oxidase FAD binding subunit
LSAAPPVTQDAALRRLIDRVAGARAMRTPLQLRGHGSKDFYGEAPRGEALDLALLAGISRYEPTELVVTARAGTPISDLEAALSEQGQCLAFEPPRFDGKGTSEQTAPLRGTVGGMVAAGLAGPARAAVGGVRDFVLGAALLNASGEVLRFGGEVMKNVAGYDIARLLVGSMGILGPVLEVSLKVLPMPPARATLRFEWPQAKALEQLQRWAGQPLPLRASAWWNDMLVVQLAGAEAAVRAAVQTLGGEVIEAAAAASFWTGLRDQRDEFFIAANEAVSAGATLWRMSVAPHAPPLATEANSSSNGTAASAGSSTNRTLRRCARSPPQPVAMPRRFAATRAAARSRRWPRRWRASIVSSRHASIPTACSTPAGSIPICDATPRQ